MIFVVMCFFLATAPAGVLLGKETYGRVPLTDQLSVTDLQPILDSLGAHHYKGRKWENLCLALGLTADTIGVIETNHIKNVEGCLNECLSRWLRKEDRVNETNWETLINALRHIGENAAAEGIDKQKQPACIIFDKYRGTVFLSMKNDPNSIARLLHAEKVIDDAVLHGVLEGNGTDTLLKAMEQVVYKNHKNLQKFAVILEKFSITKQVGTFILIDYGHNFIDNANDDVMITSKGEKITFPLSYQPEFKKMRHELIRTIKKVLNFADFSLEDIKDSLYGIADLTNCNTTRDLLQFMIDKNTLYDTTLLEAFIEELGIKGAEPIIQQYKLKVDEFCKNIPLRLNINQLLSDYPILVSETIVIEVNKEVDDKTFEDIKHLLFIAFESFSNSVKLSIIRESNSFTIICSFPLILTELLIALAFKNTELLAKEGVQHLTIGYVNVFSHKVIDTKSINVSDLIYKSHLHMHMAEHFLTEKEKFVDVCPTPIGNTTFYSWLSSLIVMCITTLILVFKWTYTKIMGRLSLINKGTKTHLLVFKEGLQEIQKEHAHSFNGLDKALAECKAELKSLYLYQKKLATPIDKRTEELPTTTDYADTTLDLQDTPHANSFGAAFFVQEDQIFEADDERGESVENTSTFTAKTQPYEQQIAESFEAFVLQPPTLDELVTYIDLGDKWYLVGTLLEINQEELNKIEQLPNKKSLNVYQLWLSSNNNPSRKLILEILKNKVVEIKSEDYEAYLRKSHDVIYVQNLDVAVQIFRFHMQSLSEVYFSPVCISQVLYSRKCISEGILDQTETINNQITLDDKKTILLAGMRETVSRDFKKLKDIATVLSEFEETKDIANKMMTNYAQEIHNGSGRLPNDVQDVDNEDDMCNILRKHYSSISKSLCEPINVAKMLHSNEMISNEVLANVVLNRGNIIDCRAVLLKAVRHAVRSNHENMQKLLSVLQIFSELADVASNIRDECEQYSIVMMNQNLSEETTDDEMSETESTLGLLGRDLHDGHSLVIRLNAYSRDFSIVRRKFATVVVSLRQDLDVISLEHLKNYIKGGYPYLFPQLCDWQNSSDALDVVCQQCSLIDISLLEGLACHYNIERAVYLINEYDKFLQKYLKDCYRHQFSIFCDKMPDSVDTLNFLVGRNVDKYTFKDITMLVEAAVLQNMPSRNFKQINFLQQ